MSTEHYSKKDIQSIRSDDNHENNLRRDLSRRLLKISSSNTEPYEFSWPSWKPNKRKKGKKVTSTEANSSEKTFTSRKDIENSVSKTTSRESSTGNPHNFLWPGKFSRKKKLTTTSEGSQSMTSTSTPERTVSAWKKFNWYPGHSRSFTKKATEATQLEEETTSAENVPSQESFDYDLTHNGLNFIDSSLNQTEELATTLQSEDYNFTESEIENMGPVLTESTEYLSVTELGNNLEPIFNQSEEVLTENPYGVVENLLTNENVEEISVTNTEIINDRFLGIDQENISVSGDYTDFSEMNQLTDALLRDFNSSTTSNSESKDFPAFNSASDESTTENEETFPKSSVIISTEESEEALAMDNEEKTPLLNLNPEDIDIASTAESEELPTEYEEIVSTQTRSNEDTSSETEESSIIEYEETSVFESSEVSTIAESEESTSMVDKETSEASSTEYGKLAEDETTTSLRSEEIHQETSEIIHHHNTELEKTVSTEFEASEVSSNSTDDGITKSGQTGNRESSESVNSESEESSTSTEVSGASSESTGNPESEENVGRESAEATSEVTGRVNTTSGENFSAEYEESTGSSTPTEVDHESSETNITNSESEFTSEVTGGTNTTYGETFSTEHEESTGSSTPTKVDHESSETNSASTESESTTELTGDANLSSGEAFSTEYEEPTGSSTPTEVDQGSSETNIASTESEEPSSTKSEESAKTEIENAPSDYSKVDQETSVVTDHAGREFENTHNTEELTTTETPHETSEVTLSEEEEYGESTISHNEEITSTNREVEQESFEIISTEFEETIARENGETSLLQSTKIDHEMSEIPETNSSLNDTEKMELPANTESAEDTTIVESDETEEVGVNDHAKESSEDGQMNKLEDTTELSNVEANSHEFENGTPSENEDISATISGSHEIEVKKLFSKADDLLDTNNFEATLGTTTEIKVITSATKVDDMFTEDIENSPQSFIPEINTGIEDENEISGSEFVGQQLFTLEALTTEEAGTEESRTEFEGNEFIDFGSLKQSTIIYDENEEQLIQTKSGEEFEILEEGDTGSLQSTATTKNADAFSVLADRATSTKPLTKSMKEDLKTRTIQQEYPSTTPAEKLSSLNENESSNEDYDEQIFPEISSTVTQAEKTIIPISTIVKTRNSKEYEEEESTEQRQTEPLNNMEYSESIIPKYSSKVIEVEEDEGEEETETPSTVSPEELQKGTSSVENKTITQISELESEESESKQQSSSKQEEIETATLSEKIEESQETSSSFLTHAVTKEIQRLEETSEMSKIGSKSESHEVTEIANTTVMEITEPAEEEDYVSELEETETNNEESTTSKKLVPPSETEISVQEIEGSENISTEMLEGNSRKATDEFQTQTNEEFSPTNLVTSGSLMALIAQSSISQSTFENKKPEYTEPEHMTPTTVYQNITEIENNSTPVLLLSEGSSSIGTKEFSSNPLKSLIEEGLGIATAAETLHTIEHQIPSTPTHPPYEETSSFSQGTTLNTLGIQTASEETGGEVPSTSTQMIEMSSVEEELYEKTLFPTSSVTRRPTEVAQSETKSQGGVSPAEEKEETDKVTLLGMSTPLSTETSEETESTSITETEITEIETTKMASTLSRTVEPSEKSKNTAATQEVSSFSVSPVVLGINESASVTEFVWSTFNETSQKYGATSITLSKVTEARQSHSPISVEEENENDTEMPSSTQSPTSSVLRPTTVTVAGEITSFAKSVEITINGTASETSTVEESPIYTSISTKQPVTIAEPNASTELTFVTQHEISSETLTTEQNLTINNGTSTILLTNNSISTETPENTESQSSSTKTSSSTETSSEVTFESSGNTESSATITSSERKSTRVTGSEKTEASTLNFTEISNELEIHKSSVSMLSTSIETEESKSEDKWHGEKFTELSLSTELAPNVSITAIQMTPELMTGTEVGNSNITIESVENTSIPQILEETETISNMLTSQRTTESEATEVSSYETLSPTKLNPKVESNVSVSVLSSSHIPTPTDILGDSGIEILSSTENGIETTTQMLSTTETARVSREHPENRATEEISSSTSSISISSFVTLEETRTTFASEMGQIYNGIETTRQYQVQSLTTETNPSVQIPNVSQGGISIFPPSTGISEENEISTETKNTELVTEITAESSAVSQTEIGTQKQFKLRITQPLGISEKNQETSETIFITSIITPEGLSEGTATSETTSVSEKNQETSENIFITIITPGLGEGKAISEITSISEKESETSKNIFATSITMSEELNKGSVTSESTGIPENNQETTENIVVPSITTPEKLTQLTSTSETTIISEKNQEMYENIFNTSITKPEELSKGTATSESTGVPENIQMSENIFITSITNPEELSKGIATSESTAISEKNQEMSENIFITSITSPQELSTSESTGISENNQETSRHIFITYITTLEVLSEGTMEMPERTFSGAYVTSEGAQEFSGTDTTITISNHRTSEELQTSNAGVISSTEFFEPSEEQLGEFAFTVRPEKSTLCETCSETEVLEQRQTTIEAGVTEIAKTTPRTEEFEKTSGILNSATQTETSESSSEMGLKVQTSTSKFAQESIEYSETEFTSEKESENETPLYSNASKVTHEFENSRYIGTLETKLQVTSSVEPETEISSVETHEHVAASNVESGTEKSEKSESPSENSPKYLTEEESSTYTKSSEILESMRTVAVNTSKRTKEFTESVIETRTSSYPEVSGELSATGGTNIIIQSTAEVQKKVTEPPKSSRVELTETHFEATEPRVTSTEESYLPISSIEISTQFTTETFQVSRSVAAESSESSKEESVEAHAISGSETESFKFLTSEISEPGLTTGEDNGTHWIELKSTVAVESESAEEENFESTQTPGSSEVAEVSKTLEETSEESSSIYMKTDGTGKSVTETTETESQNKGTTQIILNLKHTESRKKISAIENQTVGVATSTEPSESGHSYGKTSRNIELKVESTSAVKTEKIHEFSKALNQGSSYQTISSATENVQGTLSLEFSGTSSDHTSERTEKTFESELTGIAEEVNSVKETTETLEVGETLLEIETETSLSTEAANQVNSVSEKIEHISKSDTGISKTVEVGETTLESETNIRFSSISNQKVAERRTDSYTESSQRRASISSSKETIFWNNEVNSTEEVGEAQLMHFSRTQDSSTLCEECIQAEFSTSIETSSDLEIEVSESVGMEKLLLTSPRSYTYLENEETQTENVRTRQASSTEASEKIITSELEEVFSTEHITELIEEGSPEVSTLQTKETSTTIFSVPEHFKTTSEIDYLKHETGTKVTQKVAHKVSITKIGEEAQLSSAITSPIPEEAETTSETFQAELENSTGVTEERDVAIPTSKENAEASSTSEEVPQMEQGKETEIAVGTDVSYFKIEGTTLSPSITSLHAESSATKGFENLTEPSEIVSTDVEEEGLSTSASSLSHPGNPQTSLKVFPTIQKNIMQITEIFSTRVASSVVEEELTSPATTSHSEIPEITSEVFLKKEENVTEPFEVVGTSIAEEIELSSVTTFSHSENPETRSEILHTKQKYVTETAEIFSTEVASSVVEEELTSPAITSHSEIPEITSEVFLKKEENVTERFEVVGTSITEEEELSSVTTFSHSENPETRSEILHTKQKYVTENAEIFSTEVTSSEVEEELTSPATTSHSEIPGITSEVFLKEEENVTEPFEVVGTSKAEEKELSSVTTFSHSENPETRSEILHTKQEYVTENTEIFSTEVASSVVEEKLTSPATTSHSEIPKITSEVFLKKEENVTEPFEVVGTSIAEEIELSSVTTFSHSENPKTRSEIFHTKQKYVTENAKISITEFASSVVEEKLTSPATTSHSEIPKITSEVFLKKEENVTEPFEVVGTFIAEEIELSSVTTFSHSENPETRSEIFHTKQKYVTENAEISITEFASSVVEEKLTSPATTSHSEIPKITSEVFLKKEENVTEPFEVVGTSIAEEIELSSVTTLSHSKNPETRSEIFHTKQKYVTENAEISITEFASSVVEEELTSPATTSHSEIPEITSEVFLKKEENVTEPFEVVGTSIAEEIELSSVTTFSDSENPETRSEIFHTKQKYVTENAEISITEFASSVVEEELTSPATTSHSEIPEITSEVFLKKEENVTEPFEVVGTSIAEEIELSSVTTFSHSQNPETRSEIFHTKQKYVTENAEISITEFASSVVEEKLTSPATTSHSEIPKITSEVFLKKEENVTEPFEVVGTSIAEKIELSSVTTFSHSENPETRSENFHIKQKYVTENAEIPITEFASSVVEEELTSPATTSHSEIPKITSEVFLKKEENVTEPFEVVGTSIAEEIELSSVTTFSHSENPETRSEIFHTKQKYVTENAEISITEFASSVVEEEFTSPATTSHSEIPEITSEVFLKKEENVTEPFEVVGTSIAEEIELSSVTTLSHSENPETRSEIFHTKQKYVTENAEISITEFASSVVEEELTSPATTSHSEIPEITSEVFLKKEENVTEPFEVVGTSIAEEIELSSVTTFSHSENPETRSEIFHTKQEYVMENAEIVSTEVASSVVEEELTSPATTLHSEIPEITSEVFLKKEENVTEPSVVVGTFITEEEELSSVTTFSHSENPATRSEILHTKQKYVTENAEIFRTEVASSVVEEEFTSPATTSHSEIPEITSEVFLKKEENVTEPFEVVGTSITEEEELSSVTTFSHSENPETRSEILHTKQKYVTENAEIFRTEVASSVVEEEFTSPATTSHSEIPEITSEVFLKEEENVTEPFEVVGTSIAEEIELSSVTTFSHSENPEIRSEIFHTKQEYVTENAEIFSTEVASSVVEEELTSPATTSHSEIPEITSEVFLKKEENVTEPFEVVSTSITEEEELSSVTTFSHSESPETRSEIFHTKQKYVSENTEIFSTEVASSVVEEEFTFPATTSHSEIPEITSEIFFKKEQNITEPFEEDDTSITEEEELSSVTTFSHSENPETRSDILHTKQKYVTENAEIFSTEVATSTVEVETTLTTSSHPEVPESSSEVFLTKYENVTESPKIVGISITEEEHVSSSVTTSLHFENQENSLSVSHTKKENITETVEIVGMEVTTSSIEEEELTTFASSEIFLKKHENFTEMIEVVGTEVSTASMERLPTSSIISSHLVSKEELSTSVTTFSYSEISSEFVRKNYKNETEANEEVGTQVLISGKHEELSTPETTNHYIGNAEASSEQRENEFTETAAEGFSAATARAENTGLTSSEEVEEIEKAHTKEEISSVPSTGGETEETSGQKSNASSIPGLTSIQNAIWQFENTEIAELDREKATNITEKFGTEYSTYGIETKALATAVMSQNQNEERSSDVHRKTETLTVGQEISTYAIEKEVSASPPSDNFETTTGSQEEVVSMSPQPNIPGNTADVSQIKHENVTLGVGIEVSNSEMGKEASATTFLRPENTESKSGSEKILEIPTSAAMSTNYIAETTRIIFENVTEVVEGVGTQVIPSEKLEDGLLTSHTEYEQTATEVQTSEMAESVTVWSHPENTEGNEEIGTLIFTSEMEEVSEITTEITTSSELVEDAQLLHFSETEKSGTLCDECSENTEEGIEGENESTKKEISSESETESDMEETSITSLSIATFSLANNANTQSENTEIVEPEQEDLSTSAITSSNPKTTTDHLTMSSEVVDEAQLLHFSHTGESSTLCEECSEGSKNGISAEFQTESRTEEVSYQESTSFSTASFELANNATTQSENIEIVESKSENITEVGQESFISAKEQNKEELVTPALTSSNHKTTAEYLSMSSEVVDGAQLLHFSHAGGSSSVCEECSSGTISPQTENSKIASKFFVSEREGEQVSKATSPLPENFQNSSENEEQEVSTSVSTFSHPEISVFTEVGTEVHSSKTNEEEKSRTSVTISLSETIENTSEVAHLKHENVTEVSEEVGSEVFTSKMEKEVSTSTTPYSHSEITLASSEFIQTHYNVNVSEISEDLTEEKEVGELLTSGTYQHTSKEHENITEGTDETGAQEELSTTKAPALYTENAENFTKTVQMKHENGSGGTEKIGTQNYTFGMEEISETTAEHLTTSSELVEQAQLLHFSRTDESITLCEECSESIEEKTVGENGNTKEEISSEPSTKYEKEETSSHGTSSFSTINVTVQTENTEGSKSEHENITEVTEKIGTDIAIPGQEVSTLLTTFSHSNNDNTGSEILETKQENVTEFNEQQLGTTSEMEEIELLPSPTIYKQAQNTEFSTSKPSQWYSENEEANSEVELKHGNRTEVTHQVSASESNIENVTSSTTSSHSESLEFNSENVTEITEEVGTDVAISEMGQGKELSTSATIFSLPGISETSTEEVDSESSSSEIKEIISSENSEIPENTSESDEGEVSTLTTTFSDSGNNETSSEVIETKEKDVTEITEEITNEVSTSQVEEMEFTVSETAHKQPPITQSSEVVAETEEELSTPKTIHLHSENTETNSKVHKEYGNDITHEVPTSESNEAKLSSTTESVETKYENATEFTEEVITEVFTFQQSFHSDNIQITSESFHTKYENVFEGNETEIYTESYNATEQKELLYSDLEVVGNRSSYELGKSVTSEASPEKTEQSEITSPITVKLDLQNVSHSGTLMTSTNAASTEEVDEAQLFHFSKTSGGSTLCEECSGGVEISSVRLTTFKIEGSSTHEETAVSKEAKIEKTTSALMESTTEPRRSSNTFSTTEHEKISYGSEETTQITEESRERTVKTKVSSHTTSSFPDMDENGTGRSENTETSYLSSPNTERKIVENEEKTNSLASTAANHEVSAESEVTKENTEHIVQSISSTKIHTSSGAEEGQMILPVSTTKRTHSSGEPKKSKPSTVTTEKSEDFLQTLTELVGVPHTGITEVASFTESTEEREILTEIGVEDENFIMKTAFEHGNGTEENQVLPITKETNHKAFTLKPHAVITSQTKTVVVIVNNSGKKIEKINESALQKLLNKSIADVDLEYIDLFNISKRPESHTNKSDPSEMSLKGDGKECKKSDFDSNGACVCDIDDYLKSIEQTLGDDLKVDVRHYNCSRLVSFRDGLVIGNDSKPVLRKKRSLLYLINKDRSNNVIEDDNIDGVFSDDYELQATDLNVLALPGMNIRIPCHNKADALLENKGAAYSWEFKGDALKDTEILPMNENTLVIHNVEINNAGNYTCTKTESGGKKESYDHELELVTFPVYKIKMAIFYAVNDTCSLSDGDILYSYLPKMIGPILCGGSGKLCKVDVDRPRCFTRNDENFFNVTVTATMNDVNSIFPEQNESKCIDCKLKAYTNMVGLVNKNAEIVKKLPVFSRIEPHLDFLTNISFTGKSEASKPPRIVTTCVGGYGIEKSKQRICVVCPKQTFSGDDEAFCRTCPAGQYQPQPGSKACLPCSSPVDDSMCLRMLYTDTKLFKIYVGVAFGLVLLMVFVIIFWNSSSKRHQKRHFEGSLKHHRAMRRRNDDVENQVFEPLLPRNDEKKPKLPPEVPPPDF